jgi:hypothetical protein
MGGVFLFLSVFQEFHRKSFFLLFALLICDKGSELMNKCICQGGKSGSRLSGIRWQSIQSTQSRGYGGDTADTCTIRTIRAIHCRYWGYDLIQSKNSKYIRCIYESTLRSSYPIIWRYPLVLMPSYLEVPLGPHLLLYEGTLGSPCPIIWRYPWILLSGGTLESSFAIIWRYP